MYSEASLKRQPSVPKTVNSYIFNSVHENFDLLYFDIVTQFSSNIVFMYSNIEIVLELLTMTYFTY